MKIACIGNSITYGYGLSNPTAQSYPTVLQKLLGDGYRVGNFGKSGAYALPADNRYNVKDAALSYRNTSEYKASLKFDADVVVIMLGTNDIRSMSCSAAKDDFVAAIKSLAEEYAALETVKQVYLASCILTPNDDVIRQLANGEMTRLIKLAADELELPFIDVYAMTREYMDVHQHYSKDRVHPLAEGYAQIAAAMYAGLTATEPEIDSYPVSENGVVYVKDSGKANGDGKTPETAVNTLAKAVGLLRKDGGTVVVCGPCTISYTLHLPENGKCITVTSVYGGVDYRDTARARLVVKKNISLHGDYTFDDIEISSAAQWMIIAFNYNNVTIGDGVVCTKYNSSATDLLLLVGANVGIGGSPASEITLYGECNVTVDGGTWLYVKCGNRRASPAFPLGGIAEGGKLTVTVNGGVYTNSGGNNLTSVTGMNSTLGESKLVINGGDFKGPIYVVGRSGTNTSGEAAEMSGTATLEINGGTFAGKIIAVQDNSISVTGKVNVVCAAAYEDKLSGNFTDKVIK